MSVEKTLYVGWAISCAYGNYSTAIGCHHFFLCVRETCHEPILAHAAMPDGNRVHLSATTEMFV